MARKARRVALFTAGVAAAPPLFVGQPRRADAQIQVAANGVGDVLIYQYWTTSEGRDSLIAMVNAQGGQAQRFVHVRFREGIVSLDIRDFTICLIPGEVWRAGHSTGETG